MMQFKKCCGRFSLRTGSFIIGIISAASALAALVCWVAWAYSSVNRWWEDGQRWAQRARESGFPEDFVQGKLRDDFSQLSFVTHSTRVLFHLLGVVEAFHFNFSLILLYGICKERPSLLQLWVRVSVAAMALRLLLLLPVVVQMLAQDFVALGVAALALTTASIVLAAYFIVIVHNYHIELVSEKLLRIYARDWSDLR